MKFTYAFILHLFCFTLLGGAWITTSELQTIRKSLRGSELLHKEFYIKVLRDIQYNPVTLKKSFPEKKPWEDYKKFPLYEKYKNIAPILYFDKTTISEKFENISAMDHSQKMYNITDEMLDTLLRYQKDFGFPEIWSKKFEDLSKKCEKLAKNTQKQPLQEVKKEDTFTLSSLINENYIETLISGNTGKKFDENEENWF